MSFQYIHVKYQVNKSINKERKQKSLLGSKGTRAAATNGNQEKMSSKRNVPDLIQASCLFMTLQSSPKEQYVLLASDLFRTSESQQQCQSTKCAYLIDGTSSVRTTCVTLGMKTDKILELEE